MYSDIAGSITDYLDVCYFDYIVPIFTTTKFAMLADGYELICVHGILHGHATVQNRYPVLNFSTYVY